MKTIELIEYKPPLFPVSVKPKYETDTPLFKHITGGCIAVTRELWDIEFDIVAAMHGVDAKIEELERGEG